MDNKRFGKWLALNIAFQDDRFNHLGGQNISREDIATILRALVDGHYINPANYDEWDLDRELKNMDVTYWETRADYAINYSEGVNWESSLPKWVEIDWVSSAENLLQDVQVIELGDRPIATFNDQRGN